MMPMRIMIVEDDETLGNEIRNFLIRWGYLVDVAKDFHDVTSAFRIYEPQLILMDINLPFFDGFYWCTQIRAVSDIPIIFISSRSDDRDKIMAIAQGGDDYIEKPFHLELLKAKIEAVLRRTYHYKVDERIFLKEDLYFKGESSMLCYRDQKMELTRSEKRIMTLLLEHKPDVVSREDLMMELWNTDEFVSDGTLSVMISRLRTKLHEFCGDPIICTRKGQGYYIE